MVTWLCIIICVQFGAISYLVVDHKYAVDVAAFRTKEARELRRLLEQSHKGWREAIHGWGVTISRLRDLGLVSYTQVKRREDREMN